MNLFEKWLDDGRARQQASKRKLLPWCRLSEEKLLRRLRNASPPDGVKIVGALTVKSHVSATARRDIETHPHWMVRFAGFLSGFYTPLSRAADDDNHWVKQLGLDNLIGEIGGIAGERWAAQHRRRE